VDRPIVGREPFRPVRATYHFGLANLSEQGATTEFDRTETIADRPQTEDGVILGTIADHGGRTYICGTLQGVAQEIEFDWDPANLSHVARHEVLPEEAEEVILNDPLDIGIEIVGREERILNLGSTNRGRILLVVTTWREHRIRVVSAFAPAKRLIRFYLTERGV
jgi:uncharacterized DUF497 family protein